MLPVRATDPFHCVRVWFVVLCRVSAGLVTLPVLLFLSPKLFLFVCVTVTLEMFFYWLSSHNVFIDFSPTSVCLDHTASTVVSESAANQLDLNRKFDRLISTSYWILLANLKGFCDHSRLPASTQSPLFRIFTSFVQPLHSSRVNPFSSSLPPFYGRWSLFSFRCWSLNRPHPPIGKHTHEWSFCVLFFKYRQQTFSVDCGHTESLSADLCSLHSSPIGNSRQRLHDDNSIRGLWLQNLFTHTHKAERLYEI